MAHNYNKKVHLIEVGDEKEFTTYCGRTHESWGGEIEATTKLDKCNCRLCRFQLQQEHKGIRVKRP